MPSLVARPLRLAADACPLTRRISIALSMSPPASARAALQSMIPAPVRSRSALTSVAEDDINASGLSGRRPAPRQHQLRRSRTRPPPRLAGLRLAGSHAPLGGSGRFLRLLAGA